MNERDKSLPVGQASSREEVDAFLKAATRSVAAPGGEGRGRLAFAMDATISRQATWALAREIQADMFAAALGLGGLEVQLVYYRGASECRASGWVTESAALARLMGRISCEGGMTQIGRVLSHLAREGERARLRAAVFVGDAMEEDAGALYEAAGRLGVLGLKLFVFQEGRDPQVERVFREMARLTGGAWCRFSPGAGDELKALLRAVAAYAAGGRPALLASREGGAVRLLSAMGDGTT
ncbi:MAG: VWA domain-containing protein [Rhizobiales bacterium]|nr:VWA domain-containing protein [Hyphomicrobiales bacterium]